MIPKNYRPNVGIMLINQDGLIWMGKRIGADDYAYQWQMPQGGIDAGETPIEAAWRELYEETGLKKDSVKFFVESSEWLCYTFPSWIKRDPFIGNAKNGFCFNFWEKTAISNWMFIPKKLNFPPFNGWKRAKYRIWLCRLKKRFIKKWSKSLNPF